MLANCEKQNDFPSSQGQLGQGVVDISEFGKTITSNAQTLQQKKTLRSTGNSNELGKQSTNDSELPSTSEKSQKPAKKKKIKSGYEFRGF